MSLDLNINFLSIEAIFTACLLSVLSTLILSKNSKVNHFGKLRYPLLAIGNVLSLVSYFLLIGIDKIGGILWFIITGLPTFYLYYAMFASLKSELEKRFER